MTVLIVMKGLAEKKLKPVALLCDVRKSVSEILGKPFSERIDHQVFQPDKKVLAVWAFDCAERVLPLFEENAVFRCLLKSNQKVTVTTPLRAI